MTTFPTRQTYIDSEETTLGAIKLCLYDKNKVALSKDDGNDYFQATDDGLILSTGLNVIIGERTSGKTHSLNKICHNFENVKYIKQFALLQNDEEYFKKLVTTRHSLVTESYLKELKNVVLDVNEIDSKENELNIEKYITSLKKYASESDKLDSYSKCKLFNETHFELLDIKNIKILISATETLLEDTLYKDIINKHISVESLKSLLFELLLL